MIYRIQEHRASKLHYDFRLEINGKLVSWAVPRGPSLDPFEKRMAIHVDDHSIEYGDFEGVIPKGSYGAGPVLLWDRGTWECEGEPAVKLEKGRMTFVLNGEKLKGKWHLVRMRPTNWLLFKAQDKFSKAGAEAEVVKTLTRSVKSGKVLGDLI